MNEKELRLKKLLSILNPRLKNIEKEVLRYQLRAKDILKELGQIRVGRESPVRIQQLHRRVKFHNRLIDLNKVVD